MEDKQSNDQKLDPEQAAAKAALLAECKKLAAAGVTVVAVHFDGVGDEGVVEDLRCFNSEDHDHEQKPMDCDFSHLQDHFEALVPWGFENNAGGFGDVVLNVRTRKITIELNERFEEYETINYEV